MEDNNNLATEAREGEVSHYELAFHILPTVAGEEVPGVFGDIKTQIDRVGGTITQEEAPQNFDLAYTVVKHTEGKNYKFNHSYFGWVRFTAEGSAIESLKSELAHEGRILRSLLIKLTKGEMEHPFKVFEKHTKKHEAPADAKPVSEAEIEKAVQGITE